MVRYNDAQDCFLLETSSNNPGYPIVWPPGTRASSKGTGVELIDGREFRAGDTLSGAGGYERVADDWEVPEPCRVPTGEVVVIGQID